MDEAKKAAYLTKFDTAVFNDVATPQALAVMWEVVKDSTLNNATKWAILSDMDGFLGLNMAEMKEQVYVPDEEVQALLDARKEARAAKDWAKSDEIRDALKAKGLTVKDLPNGEVQINKI